MLPVETLVGMSATSVTVSVLGLLFAGGTEMGTGSFGSVRIVGWQIAAASSHFCASPTVCRLAHRARGECR